MSIRTASSLAVESLEGPEGGRQDRTATGYARERFIDRRPAASSIAPLPRSPSRPPRRERTGLIDEWQRLRRASGSCTKGRRRRCARRQLHPHRFSRSDPTAEPTRVPAASSVCTCALCRSTTASRPPRSVLLTCSAEPGRTSGAALPTSRWGHTRAEILAVRFPRGSNARPAAHGEVSFDGYLDRVDDRDVRMWPRVVIRSPAALRRWMTTYAAAVITMRPSRRFAMRQVPARRSKPSKKVTQQPRDVLDERCGHREDAGLLLANSRLGSTTMRVPGVTGRIIGFYRRDFDHQAESFVAAAV